jgi:hypothetical protein
MTADPKLSMIAAKDKSKFASNPCHQGNAALSA